MVFVEYQLPLHLPTDAKYDLCLGCAIPVDSGCAIEATDHAGNQRRWCLPCYHEDNAFYAKRRAKRLAVSAKIDTTTQHE